MDAEVQTFALQLAEAAIRNSAASISGRISVSKAKKKDQETIAELEEIVNSLIADKNEVIRIAQAYEDELVAQKLSPDEVEYITTKMLPVLEHLSDGDAKLKASLEAVKSIVSVETVTILQLIGFNFKRALGEPLTELVSDLIAAKGRQSKPAASKSSKPRR